MQRYRRMTKEKLLASGVASFVLIVLLGCISMANNWGSQETETTNEPVTYKIKVESGRCTDGDSVLKHFMKTAEQREYQFIIIDNYIDTDDLSKEKKLQKQMIYYNGESYSHNNQGDTQNYAHFYTVEGTMPNAAVKTTMYIMADEVYSFEQLSNSLLSSQSTDHLEYALICFTYA